MEAILFVGVQGSGKSTFYRRRFSETHLRINLDMLKTRRRERLILEACIAARQPFVVDNTNPTAETRARYIAPARAAGFRLIAYYFSTPLQEAMRRNGLRAGKQKIPAVAVAGTFRKIERPTVEEGFDEIHTVELTMHDEFEVS